MVGMKTLVPAVGVIGTTTAVGGATGFGLGMFQRQTGGDPSAPITGIEKGLATGAAIGAIGFGSAAGIRALKTSRFTNAIDGLTEQQQQLYRAMSKNI